MADPAKIGKPWEDEELDAIVAHYFAMLDAELSGRSEPAEAGCASGA